MGRTFLGLQMQVFLFRCSWLELSSNNVFEQLCEQFRSIFCSINRNWWIVVFDHRSNRTTRKKHCSNVVWILWSRQDIARALLVWCFSSTAVANLIIRMCNLTMIRDWSSCKLWIWHSPSRTLDPVAVIIPEDEKWVAILLLLHVALNN